METVTLDQIADYRYKPIEAAYSGPTQYMGLELPPWSHPTALVNEILSKIKHSIVVGMQFNGPMGEGKTSAATVIAHHIHTLRPEFNIIWAGVNEFKNMTKFLEELPKYQPVLIIFDDVTSALKSMSDKDIHRNFNALTRIRHIIDPAKGKTPIIVFTIGHYSKNLEKEYRNILTFNSFLAWTNEEHSNIETIAPKNTQARYEVLKYGRMYAKMYSSEKFFLRLGNGKRIEYELDNPLRPFCCVHGTEAKIIVFDEKDCCQLCSKKAKRKVVDALEVYNRIKKAHGPSGVQALRLCLWRRGYYRALPRKVATASEFIEERLLSEVTTDFEDLLNLTWTQNRKAPPKQLYHHKKDEDQLMSELHEIAVEHDIEPIKQEEKTDDTPIQELGLEPDDEEQ